MIKLSCYLDDWKLMEVDSLCRRCGKLVCVFLGSIFDSRSTSKDLVLNTYYFNSECEVFVPSFKVFYFKNSCVYPNNPIVIGLISAVGIKKRQSE